MRKSINDNKQSRSGKFKPAPKLVVKEPVELMKFLLESLPGKSRDNIKSLLKNKQVIVDGNPVSQYNHLLMPEQIVEIGVTRAQDEMHFRGISIVYEDDSIIVVDKHAGVLSVSVENKNAPTAYNMLSFHVKQQNYSNKIFIVHRLDRETSGLLIFAKSEKIQALLQESWQNTIIERSYLAVVEGKVEKLEDTITSYLVESKALIVYSSQNPEHGKKAITHYKVQKSNDKYSLLKVDLETGRKNQIRVHMKDIGHPIVGDKKYGSATDPIGRLGLHAWVLGFTHPVTGEQMRFETTVPRKFTRLI
jgi:23S rRNA pseudouridine1911/1915/1917 synthase